MSWLRTLLRTALAWVLAPLRPREATDAPSIDHRGALDLDAPSIDHRGVAPSTDAPKLDHGGLARPGSNPDTPTRRATDAPSIESRGAMSTVRVFVPPRIDGGTAWSIPPPPDGWPGLVERLRQLVRQRCRSAVVADRWGEAITVAIGAEKGKLIVETGMARLELWARGCELRISALAAETEGVAAWLVRELPRWCWWLRMAELPDVEPDDYKQLGPHLRLLGVTVRRIESCTDVGGWPIEPGLVDQVIARHQAHDHVPHSGVRSGVTIGSSSATLHGKIYNKRWELDVQRGPEHAALLERVRAGGYVDGDSWTRVEWVAQRSALMLEGEGDEQINGRDPLAPCDPEIIATLWRHFCTEVRVVQLGQRAKPSDNPNLPEWDAIRDAAGQAATLRLRRAASTAQLAEVRGHARERLGHELATVGALAGATTADQAGVEARREVDRLLSEREAIDRFNRARARYADLLEQVRGGEADADDDH